jgi:hypothetical protein
VDLQARQSGDIAKFDLKEGSQVMILNPDDLGLSGDVTSRFQKVDGFPF